MKHINIQLFNEVQNNSKKVRNKNQRNITFLR
jgi:hypothetical protein